MKTFLKILAALVVLGAVAFGTVIYMTQGSREAARQFVLLSTSGDYVAASALFHEALKAEFPMESFETSFAGVKPYTEVSFSSISSSGSGTNLEGTASTADGCTSKVSFEILGGLIVAFDITPLCRQ